MIKRTVNPAERAASIADREAEEVWRKTGNYQGYLETWFSVYKQSLSEFVEQLQGATRERGETCRTLRFMV